MFRYDTLFRFLAYPQTTLFIYYVNLNVSINLFFVTNIPKNIHIYQFIHNKELMIITTISEKNIT